MLLTGCAGREPRDTAPATDGVRRLCAILDYVAADYGLAVNGAVVDSAEYAEQLAFVADAARLARALPDATADEVLDLRAELAALHDLVQRKAPAPEVAGRCQRLRCRILDAYRVVLAPAASPSWERGEAVYQGSCVPCHGPSGAGDGPRAAELRPTPRSFQDAATMRTLSPARVFNALTDGIEGTAMPSFEVVAASDRWSLAFYILALRHAPPAAMRGEEVLRQHGLAAPSVERLAEASDGDLLGELERARVGEGERMDALAYLRREAPYIDGKPLSRAHALLRAAERAYAQGDRHAALDAVTAAYLDGLEPVEGALRTREPGLVSSAEARFLALRELMSNGASRTEVMLAARRVHERISRAQVALEESGDARMAFAAAATVLLREGVESVLLVLLLLGLARRAGGRADLWRVHAGWMGALIAGAVLWFVAGAAVPLTGASRELVEGVIALAAAVILIYASHFVLARMSAQRRIEAMRLRFAAAGHRKRGLVLLSLGFAAVFREALEVVLFLQAIMLEAPRTGRAVALGAATGAAACGVLCVALRATGRRLNPGQLLTASGAILCTLAVVMAGKGVRALQEAGAVGVDAVAFPRIDWLGIYPSWQTVLVQGAVLIAILAIAFARPRATVTERA